MSSNHAGWSVHSLRLLMLSGPYISPLVISPVQFGPPKAKERTALALCETINYYYYVQEGFLRQLHPRWHNVTGTWSDNYTRMIQILFKSMRFTILPIRYKWIAVMNLSQWVVPVLHIYLRDNHLALAMMLAQMSGQTWQHSTPMYFDWFTLSELHQTTTCEQETRIPRVGVSVCQVVSGAKLSL